MAAAVGEAAVAVAVAAPASHLTYAPRLHTMAQLQPGGASRQEKPASSANPAQKVLTASPKCARMLPALSSTVVVVSEVTAGGIVGGFVAQGQRGPRALI